MNSSAAGLTRDDIEEFLSAMGVGDQDLQELRDILRTCDTIQYSPLAGDARQAEDTLASAKSLVKTLEKDFLS